MPGCCGSAGNAPRLREAPIHQPGFDAVVRSLRDPGGGISHGVSRPAGVGCRRRPKPACSPGASASSRVNACPRRPRTHLPASVRTRHHLVRIGAAGSEVDHRRVASHPLRSGDCGWLNLLRTYPKATKILPMSRDRRSTPERYTWLPHKAVRACQRLSKRHSELFQGAHHFAIDVAAFLAIMAFPARGTRRSRQDILDGLTLVTEMKVLTEAAEERLLREARRRGITFQEIAEAMAMRSRQAAEQRFIRLVGGSGPAEQAQMNRRRRERFGYEIDAQGRHEDHMWNLGAEFRSLALESLLPDEIATEEERP